MTGWFHPVFVTLVAIALICGFILFAATAVKFVQAVRGELR